MTVLALKAESHDVVLVAERYRLIGALALPSNPWGALQLIERYSKCNHNQPRQHQARPSQRVGAAVKNLRHELSPVSSNSGGG